MLRRMMPMMQRSLCRRIQSYFISKFAINTRLGTSKAGITRAWVHPPPLCLYSTYVNSQNVEVERVIDPYAQYAVKPAYKATEEEIQSATEELASLNEKDTRMLKIIKMEWDVMGSLGHKFPDNVHDAMWLDLLKSCPNRNQRMKRLKFWFKVEKSEANERLKKEARNQRQLEKRLEYQELLKDGLPPHKNTYMMRVIDTTINKHYMNNMYYSMMNGPHLVFDMGFGEYMTDKELKDLMRQLHQSYGANKLATEPFHFHLCNVPRNGRLDKYIEYHFPGVKAHLPISLTDQSYLDIYPKEKLVYLTPNTRNVLKTIDPDDVYIVGGIVDLANEQPLTFAKAKKEDIRMAKLPLDNYMRWVQGSKALPCNQITEILLTFKQTQDWHQALKHVPTRKAILYD